VAGSDAISNSDPAIIGWASAVANYSPGTNVDAVWSSASKALGRAEGAFDSVVSLGRGGSLTLRFDTPIRDGLGDDFAVFENAVNDTFLELGFVEVSSDGVNFVRFAADSRTAAPVASFGAVDPTNLNNLAGKYRAGFGTPFDLGELRGRPGLDVTAVTHVRLVDIVGDGTTRDASGDPIYDPTPTFQSAGLDVDGVGVIHAVATGEVVIDFETLGAGLGAATFNNGANGSGGFREQEISLNNNYSTQFNSWSGWSISQSTDNTTAGFANQYGAITGGGFGNSETYAVGFFDSSPSGALPPPTITLDPASGSRFDSFYVTNTTYATRSMQNGDAFAKKFGGPSGADPDFLRLTVTGVDAAGNAIGSIQVSLADYTPAASAQDSIMQAWTRVDVSSLSRARALRFTMQSSDNSPFGMNTPAFFAVDNVTLRRAAVPFDIASPQTTEDRAVLARVSRPTADTSAPIVVTMSRSGSDAASVPTTVTIPRGAAFTEFNITPANDAIPTPDRSLSITAQADNLLPTTRSLVIVDDEALAISFASTLVNVNEGAGSGAATLVLTRNDADISGPLTVSLTPSQTNLLGVPSTVTFAATQRQVTIPIDVLDDMNYGSGQTVLVQAFTPGRDIASATIQISENDVPTLRIEPATIRLSESSPATTRTVSLVRNTVDTSLPITVSLLLPDGGPLTIPGQITLGAGEASASFVVGVVDDALVNPRTTYRIAASNANFVSGSLDVEITDNDTATLQLELRDLAGNAITEIPEATPFRATVRRSAVSLASPQTITLSSTLGGRVKGTGEITIPAGFESTSVTLTVASDNVATGNFGMQLAASAIGFASTTTDISIINTDLPRLQIVAPENGLSEGDAVSLGDLEELGLGLLRGEFQNNAGASSGFSMGPIGLSNSFDNSFGFDNWSGFAISRGIDSQTSGFSNQYSSITGSGADESSTYAVAYVSGLTAITRANDQPAFSTLDITNTTYAALSMRDGDDFAKKFGGESGDDPDYFLLQIDGLDSEGNLVGTIDVFLADYRFENNEQDYILTDWTTVDVSSIGSALSLNMRLSSSDNHEQFGMNTPAYFAVDNVRLASPTMNLPTISITRPGGDVSAALEVNLSGDRSELSIPDRVTIPAGELRVDVPVVWTDNSLFDGPRTWKVTASADGFSGATSTIELRDDETAALTVTLSSDEVNEASGMHLVHFEDIGSSLANQSFNHGVNGRGGFRAGSLTLPTAHDPTFGSWSGWAASNMTDVTTAGFTNQFSAYANLDQIPVGGGVGGGGTFAVAGGYGAEPLRLNLPAQFSGSSFESLAITNTTYAALSILQGDDFAKKFGGESGDDPDFFLLTIEGFDAQGESIETIDFYLADYRFEDNSQDYVVDDWTTIDLTALATATSLTFSMSSSDVGNFGMNTPAFFAIDDVLIRRSDSPPPSLVVHRNTVDLNEDLVVSIELDSSSVLSAPSTIVIPAGQDRVRVSLELDDTAGYRDDDSIRIIARATGFASDEQSLRVIEDDLPPSQFRLQNLRGDDWLLDDAREAVIESLSQTAPIVLTFDDAAQQFTHTPLTNAAVTIELAGGDDMLTLNSSVFDKADGGGGVDTVIIAPVDVPVGDVVDVADWLTQRVVGFETIVLGAAALGHPAVPFALDAAKLQTQNSLPAILATAPRVVTAVDQALQWIGDWRLGEPVIENGVFTARVISDNAEVWVATNRPWQNVHQKFDVNASGDVTSVDALAIINRLNSDGSAELAMSGSGEPLPSIYYDVSGDGLITAVDALQVINWLNEQDNATVPTSEPLVPLVQPDNQFRSVFAPSLSNSPLPDSLPVQFLNSTPSTSAINFARLDEQPSSPEATDLALSDLDLLSSTTDSIASSLATSLVS
jgi:hypothetical protein